MLNKLEKKAQREREKWEKGKRSERGEKRVILKGYQKEQEGKESKVYWHFINIGLGKYKIFTCMCQYMSM